MLLKATHGNFRAGMLLNILFLGALALAMIHVARQARDGRTSLADAFFPIALLHLGNWENLFWSWQFTLIAAVGLSCVVLLVLVAYPTLSRPGPVIVAGLCMVLLPLSGANGVLVVPLLALWLGYRGVLQWRTAAQTGEQRWIGAFLVCSATVALALTGLYFVGYERPPWTPAVSGPGLLLRTVLQFLALGLGPIARRSWPLSLIAATAILLPTAVVAVDAVFRYKSSERLRAWGILLFLGSLSALSLAMGWGRAAVIPIYGHWPLRYVLLAAPVFCTAFFVWVLYGPPKLRAAMQSILFLSAFVLIPLNTIHGFQSAQWFRKPDKALMQDLAAGTSLSAIAERHRSVLYPHIEPRHLTEMMEMLRKAGIRPFALTSHNQAARGMVSSSEIPPLQLPATQEFRYQMPSAGEVFLVWGVDGWHTIPEAERPAGTVLEDGIMHTPMFEEGKAFVADVQVPAGTVIDYGFLITRRRDGTKAHIWEADGAEDYHTIAAGDGVVEIQTRLVTPEDQAAANVLEDSFVTQEIEYEMPSAAEVYLVWGVNGWTPVPASLRPRGTEFKEGAMHTPMAREDSTFVVQIQVPTGTAIDYGFLTTKTRDGFDVSVWESIDAPLTALQDGSVKVQTSLTVVNGEPMLQIDDARLVAQEIRYHMAEAGEVFFAWGINGWHALPREVRPAGTVMKDGVMHTPMIREGDTFVTEIDAPLGTRLDYGFLITERRGILDLVEPVWDSEQHYYRVLSGTDVIEVETAVTLGDELREVLNKGPYFVAGIGVLLGTWLVISFLLGLRDPHLSVTMSSPEEHR
jgi:hypothetical protein